MTGPVDDPCPPNPGTSPDQNKYFHEVGADMIGNQLIIRMEKDKKRNKKKGLWEPPCDCDVIEIKRPTGNKGPKIVNGGDNNQILFRIHSRGHLAKKEDPNYRPQAIAYKINRSETVPDDHCRKITVYPQLGGPITQEVFTDHLNDCDQDIYLLRVKKKNDSKNEGENGKSKPHPARNLEVELRTPKPPPPKPCTPAPPPPPEPEEKKDDDDDDKKDEDEEVDIMKICGLNKNKKNNKNKDNKKKKKK